MAELLEAGDGRGCVLSFGAYFVYEAYADIGVGVEPCEVFGELTGCDVVLKEPVTDAWVAVFVGAYA